MSLEQAIVEIVDRRLAQLGYSGTHSVLPVSPLPSPAASAPIPPPTSASAPHLRCFKCAAEGKELRNKTTGEIFYACPDAQCGFTGKEGKWHGTSWNADTWQERKAKHEQFSR